MKRYAIVLVAAFCVLGFPAQARADVGTPLLWAGLLHLIFGNALIGLGEGLVISWLFSVRRIKAIGIMIPANYFSAWLGFFFVGGMSTVLPVDLNTFWRWFWIMVIATYCMTLMLEWPFVVLCFRGRKDWFRKSVLASLVVQTASYLVLFTWYGLAGTTQLYSNLKVVKPDEFTLPGNIGIYFISSIDGNVYRTSLKGGAAKKIYDLHSTNLWESLLVQRDTLHTNSWNLVTRMETSDFLNPRLMEIVKGIPIEAAPQALAPENHSEPPIFDASNGDQAKRFGSLTNSSWIVYTQGWNHGITCYNLRSSQRMYLACDTVFCTWDMTRPVYLSPDLVLFQLGGDQICVFSPEQRKVALLFRGRGAVPVME